jgi:hypothetical protein
MTAPYDPTFNRMGVNPLVKLQADHRALYGMVISLQADVARLQEQVAVLQSEGAS